MAQAIFLIKNGPASEAFELREIPEMQPQAGQIRLQVEAFGLNFADVLARLGLYPEAPKPPAILGYEVVGRIDQVGPGVTRFKNGQRVLAFTRFGGYATQAIALELAAVEIPESLDAAAATALGTQYCTAYFAAEDRVHLNPQDQVLVHAAAGGVGIALIQLLKRRQCVIYATASSSEKLEFLRSLGVDYPINYRETDFKSEIQKILDSRSPSRKGLDVVFDSLGGETARKSRSLLGPGGRLVSYGAANMAISGNKAIQTLNAIKTIMEFGLLSPLSLLTRSQSYIGINMLTIADSRPEILSRCMKEVLALAVNGSIQPHLGKVFLPSEIAEAHEFLGNRSSIGKVAIRWT